MCRQLPPFEPLTEPEMRALWTRHRDADVRRLILEVARYRLVIKNWTVLQEHPSGLGCKRRGDLVALLMMLQVLTVELQPLPRPHYWLSSRVSRSSPARDTPSRPPLAALADRHP